MRTKKSGFTIVELLIVIVVIAVLSAITMVAYGNISARARDAQRVRDIAIIKKALLAYEAERGGVPHTATAPRYNLATSGSGGWDSSTHENWLVFLRQDYGTMPVDPTNTTVRSDPTLDAGSRAYTYYCYPTNGAPFVQLTYRNEAGTRVNVNFPVTACL